MCCLLTFQILKDLIMKENISCHLQKQQTLLLRFVDRGQRICNNNFLNLFWLKQSIQAYLVKHIHHIIVYKTNINILKPNVVSKCSREVVKFPILSLCHNFSLHLRRKIFFIIHVGWYRYICKTARPRKRWRRLHNLRLNNNTSLCQKLGEMELQIRDTINYATLKALPFNSIM